MSKYDARFKRLVVKDYLSGRGGSSKEVARRHGIDYGTVRKWAAGYQAHGEAALKKKYSQYDARFKLKVLRFMLARGLSCRETAAVFDIRNAPRIAVWKRQYDYGGLQALESRPRGRPVKQSKPPSSSEPTRSDNARTKEELLEELNYLRMENAYLKKLDALIRSERPQRSAKGANSARVKAAV